MRANWVQSLQRQQQRQWAGVPSSFLVSVMSLLMHVQPHLIYEAWTILFFLHEELAAVAAASIRSSNPAAFVSNSDRLPPPITSGELQ
jgi:hypothetical protein